MVPFKKQVPKNPLAEKLYRAQKKMRWLKIRLFLLFTLPIAVVTIGQAVLKEYIRIRVRQAAAHSGNQAQNELNQKQDTLHQEQDTLNQKPTI